MPNLPAPYEGRFDGDTHVFALRVYYDDTDAGGVVYHTSYLKWFERARSDMVRLLGIDQPAALADGLGAYAVTDLSARYARPARLGDAVLVSTRLTDLKTASWRVEQSAMRGDEVLVHANVRIGFVAPDGRPSRHPAGWREALGSVLVPEGAA